ncbi:S-adenosyl-L-methionine-dependent methyltransferase [Melanomma pulvis-pyrius CBS 109.77]|uniref:S-adenosyl-L-methionine-dependent methyltransferase n=1 Tax=Melanomma pulvis-pyrius CBS 109.77 TaxID=1314802 RepID=A0A6A6XQA7_9PLEO|nr:S-adenosyl-L-methionine-dependent methyltransferase [Melanomma pulvis-pyrius CBS 109.77]
MSQSPIEPVTEKTFSSYNRQQGSFYASVRRDYHPSLYQTVLNHHTSTGGQLHTLLDVGCGPGSATRALAPHFAHATGLDPSEGMLDTARSLGGVTSNSEPIRYGVSTAEHLGENLLPPIVESSVDLITAANAAHWFNMPPFWARAAHILKPGGTVALWTSSNICAHPSMPNAAAIQAAFDQHQERHLVPYFEPGNLLTRNRYATLPLPWTMEQPVPEFDPSSFFRKNWEIGEPFYTGEQGVDLDMFEKMLATGSPQTRWHQAHLDLVGTEKDVVRILRREIERLLHEAGVEKGTEKVQGTVQGTLLMFKKKM